MNHKFSDSYELSRIFIGNVNGKKKFLYSVYQGEKYELIPETSSLSGAIRYSLTLDKNQLYDKNEVTIICSFQELIEKEKVAPLLLNSQYQYIPKISRTRIQLVKDAIANKKSKFASSLNKLYNLADFTASIICDELGFNVAVNPMTSIIDVTKIHNVALPATKVARFKDALTEYIYVRFLTEQRESYFHDYKERSSCIAGCLCFSKIELTDNLLQNEVSVQPDLRTGTVTVKGELLKPEFVQEPTDFQKVHILSVK